MNIIIYFLGMLCTYYKSRAIDLGEFSWVVPFTASERDSESIHVLGLSKATNKISINTANTVFIQSSDGRSCTIEFDSATKATNAFNELNRIDRKTSLNHSDNLENAVRFMRIPEFLERHAN